MKRRKNIAFGLSIAAVHTLTVYFGWSFFLDCPIKHAIWIFPFQWVSILTIDKVCDFFREKEQK